MGLRLDAAQPQVGNTLARIAWALARFPEVWLLLMPALYTALAVASPLLRAYGHPAAGTAVFALFHGWCHQLPSRSLFLDGYPMAVCSRCFSLGASVVVAGLLSARIAAFGTFPRHFRVPFWGIGLAAVPMALDGFSQLFGLRESNNTLRVITGCLLGGAVAFWAIPALYDAFDEIKKTHA